MKARSASALAMCLLATIASRTAQAADPPPPPSSMTAGGLSPVAITNQGPIETTSVTTPQTPGDAASVPVPGRPLPPGLGLSPEAAQAPPAPGATPSFGSTKSLGDATFQLGGNVSLIGTWGIAHRVGPTRPGQSELVLHAPARASRVPIFGGPTARLRITYGTPVLSANVQFFAQPHGKEWEGFNNPQRLTQFNQAYLQLTPPPLGKTRLQVRVGAFSDVYGSPGEWGWGVYGPLLALRGYGEGMTAEYDLNADWRLGLAHGIGGIPEVPEEFVRGTFAGYNGVGVSTVYQHAHMGFTYQGKHSIKLHAATVYGTDERVYLVPQRPDCTPNCRHDGRMNIFVVESHYQHDPLGQFGLSAALYDLDHSNTISDGVWWTLGFTQGGQDIGNNYVGSGVFGYTPTTGKVEVVAAEWDMSLARILWYPQPFDGMGPDLRLRLAGHVAHTSAAADSAFRDQNAYNATFDVEYRMFSWLSAWLRGFAESREVRVKFSGSTVPPNVPGRGEQMTLAPGISFRSNWQSTDHIDLIYTRAFMNRFIDTNPGMPFDRNIVTLWASLDF